MRGVQSFTVIATIACAVLPFSRSLGSQQAASVQSNLQTGVFLIHAGRYQEAAAILGSALKHSGQTEEQTVEAINDLGVALYYSGKFPQAESIYLRALRMRARLSPRSKPDPTTLLNNLATLYRHMGRLKDAEQIHLQVLHRREEQEGLDSINVAITLTNLAEVYRAEMKYGKAETAARRAVRILSNAGKPELLVLSNSLDELAATREAQGDLKEANALLEREKAIRESLLDRGDPRIAASVAAIGALRIKQHRYEDAERLLRGALDMWRASGHGRSPEAAVAINNLAQVCKLTGRYREAEELYRSAIALWLHTRGKQEPEYGLFLDNLADLERSTRSAQTAPSRWTISVRDLLDRSRH